MPQQERWSVSWRTEDGRLEAHEPLRPEIAAVSGQLSVWYNEPHNRAMMSNDDAMSPQKVREHYAHLAGAGGRNFLLFLDGRLMGDADLRRVDPAARTAEFAILIGERRVQGCGYGTRFALMVHVLAFLQLGLERVYATVIPANLASLRLFDKLGYRGDLSPAARSYLDQADDVTLSIGRDEFLHRHGETARRVELRRVTAR